MKKLLEQMRIRDLINQNKAELIELREYDQVFLNWFKLIF